VKEEAQDLNIEKVRLVNSDCHDANFQSAENTQYIIRVIYHFEREMRKSKLIL
jgi:hypothetical protein